MKALLSSLLLGAALVLSAPNAAAQYVGASGYIGHGGYVTSRIWVPGHFETVSERVWIAGPCRREWVAPVYEWQFGPCGLRYVCARAGYWRTVELPGHFEERCVRVWRDGHWAARGRY